jgi:hypothetical protein
MKKKPRMEYRQTQYKWEILAWSALKKDGKKWVLHESDWFNKKEDCIKNLQEKTERGYDIADSLGSEEYILKRKVIPPKYRLRSKPPII